MKLKDKKIKIYYHEEGVNENGFPVDQWRLLHEGTLWAYYRQLSGREFFAAATVNQTEEVTFLINWRNDLNTAMLIDYKGKLYDITRIDDFEGYKKELQIYCKLSATQEIEIAEE
ncbi:MAG: phage head closure protein [Clostridia bacterium]|nr:phage head closure protein [Clostridia bacterium]